MERVLPWGGEGQIVLARGFVPKDEADALFSNLMDARDEIKYEVVTTHGKTHTVRRRTAYVGEKGSRYRYAGGERRATPWGESRVGKALLPLRVQLLRDIGEKFSYALVNLYEDGRVGLGPHSDDETDLRADAPIASVNLGETRAMRFHKKGDKKRNFNVQLHHGDLLLMEPPLQEHWKHSIPTRRNVKGPRINVTFRVVRS